MTPFQAIEAELGRIDELHGRYHDGRRWRYSTDGSPHLTVREPVLHRQGTSVWLAPTPSRNFKSWRNVQKANVDVILHVARTFGLEVPPLPHLNEVDVLRARVAELERQLVAARAEVGADA